MISEIQIKNFKSIADLTLRPGSVTVLIGENGSGKSNILEAIAFAAAASADKLDDEFLFNRGIRVTGQEWMISRFVDPVKLPSGKTTIYKPIAITVLGRDPSQPLGLRIHRDILMGDRPWTVTHAVGEEEIGEEMQATDFEEELEQFSLRYLEAVPEMPEFFVRDLLAHTKAVIKKRREAPEVATRLTLKDFLIYAPENSILRNFETEGAIKPLGTKGEGLLRLLQRSVEKGNGEFSSALKTHLGLLGWFEDVELPTEEDEIRGRLRISDRWLPGKGRLFDQRSANEGFLYLLFYFTLFLSKQTPPFFAIDNIDNSLNPKLCTELMRQLAVLARDTGKQVICTTHNPAILDGLDLTDENQKLYSVNRNSDGHTVVHQIPPSKGRSDGRAPMKLSAAFMSGLLGGLPEHF